MLNTKIKNRVKTQTNGNIISTVFTLLDLGTNQLSEFH